MGASLRAVLFDLDGTLIHSLPDLVAAVNRLLAGEGRGPLDSEVVKAMVGDGAMQMNNMAELITVAKYWKRWSSPKWTVCVWNNEDLNQVTWEQRVMEGDPRFDASQNLPNVPYHRFARLIGLKGIYVDDPRQLGAAWEEALASDVPTVLEVKTDPEVPPLPAHISFQQARNFTSMLLKGDPDEHHLIADTARQVLSAVLPSGDKT